MFECSCQKASRPQSSVKETLLVVKQEYLDFFSLGEKKTGPLLASGQLAAVRRGMGWVIGLIGGN